MQNPELNLLGAKSLVSHEIYFLQRRQPEGVDVRLEGFRVFSFLKRLFVGDSSLTSQPVAAERGMTYTPRIVSADPQAKYEVAGREAVLLANIVSAGMVQYLYILVVYAQDGEPCLFVASEVNAEREAFGGGSHFLGVFTGEGHLNLGDSDEWANREQFVEKALAIAREHLAAR